MLSKKNICNNCLTGRMTYELDRHSEVCPYIQCLQKNKCPFYTPEEKGFFGKITDLFKNDSGVKND